MPKYAKELSKLIEKKLDGRPQLWLSVHSGVGTSALSRIMAGEGLPNLENLMKIADALGLEPNEILNPIFRSGQKSEKSDEAELSAAYQELLSIVARLPASRLRRLVGTARLLLDGAVTVDEGKDSSPRRG